jgi:AcrR family transcriptional regulator
MSSEFRERLQQAFGFATMAAIARRLGLPHATVRNYFNGRLPAPDVLIKIGNETNVSLNWLLSGAGDMFLDQDKRADFGSLLEQKIEELIDRKLAAMREEDVQELGDVDVLPVFDIEAALARSDDPQEVMREWFRHEDREYPDDYGIVFFQGWESYSPQEKKEAVKDAKKVLDRTLAKS